MKIILTVTYFTIITVKMLIIIMTQVIIVVFIRIYLSLQITYLTNIVLIKKMKNLVDLINLKILSLEINNILLFMQ